MNQTINQKGQWEAGMIAYFTKHKVIFFYLFAFTISWTAWTAMGLLYQGNSVPSGSTDYFFLLVPSTIGGLGPLFALMISEKLTGKEVELEKIVSTAKIRGVSKLWFIPAIFAYPIIAILGNLLSFLAGWENQLILIKPGPDTLGLFVLPIMAIHFTASLVTSPLFEEPGWRGFALTNLQARFGTLIGSIIVGALWWLWHQPMNITFGIQPSVYGFLSMVAFSFMIDSLFNLSGKNLFTAMLAHQSSGTLFIFIFEGQQNLFTLIMLIAFAFILRLKEFKRKKGLKH